jgi:hypothetical protein
MHHLILDEVIPQTKHPLIVHATHVLVSPTHIQPKL